MPSAVRLLAVLACTASRSEDFTFLTIGDWGGTNLGGYHEADQKAVAKQMGKTAAEHKIKFVVNVGDNFYYNGVKSQDDPLWKTDFTDIYTDASLQVPWYSALGNHDYGLCPGCQVNYTKDARFVMPARYYTKRIELSSTKQKHATFVFLDSNPCISGYRSDDKKNWDPDLESFHQNVIKESCTQQAAWWNRTFSAIPQEDWIIVVAHHPADEIDVVDPMPVFNAFNMDLFLAGHVHTLQQFKMSGSNADFVISGAGCMVKVEAENATLRNAVPLERGAGRESNKPTQVWNSKTAGFTIQRFNSEFTELTTEFYDYTGKILHRLTTKKH